VEVTSEQNTFPIESVFAGNGREPSFIPFRSGRSAVRFRPCRHVFKDLQVLQSEIWFQFQPANNVSCMLRQEIDYRLSFAKVVLQFISVVVQ
jgi:hypothetical protein